MPTKIQWSQETWNVVLGCSKLSAGCMQCYAVGHVHRLAGNPNPTIKAANEGLTRRHTNGQLDWSGVVRFIPERLTQPLRWKEPKLIFVNSLSDVFHEDLPVEVIAQIFGVIIAARRHTFQILTKRPERMADLLNSEKFRRHAEKCAGDYTHLMPDWPLANCWIGTSVEDQAAAEKRIPHLLRAPAAVRFLSCEPLLGEVNLDPWLWEKRYGEPELGSPLLFEATNAIDWVIIGGESGHRARPLQATWISNLISDCEEAEVKTFVKQTGAVWARDHGYQDRKGGDPSEWPLGWQIQQFPEVAHAG